MGKIPRDDPRARYMASDIEVDLDGVIEFATGRHHLVLTTTRRDGRPQMSLVTGTITPTGEILISTYPQRAKTRNAERDSRVSVLFLGDEFDDAWVQVDGDAEVTHVPDSVDGLVEYFQVIRGDHPDWDEYRQAMLDQGKSVIRIRPTRWGPVSRGGFPPELFEDE